MNPQPPADPFEHQRLYRLSARDGSRLAFVWASSLQHAIVRYESFYPGCEACLWSRMDCGVSWIEL